MSELTSKTEAFGQDVYFVNGYTVSEDTYFAVQSLEKERDELRAKVERLSERGIEDMKFEISELREFKEKVNKELRIWNNEDCNESAYMKALCNIEEMMLEGGE